MQRGEGFSNKRARLRLFLAVSICVLEFRIFTKCKSCCSLYRTKNTCTKCALSFEGLSLLLSTQVDIDIYQTFPLHFCILQAIKNWMVGRPGNEAMKYQLKPITGSSSYHCHSNRNMVNVDPTQI